MWLVYKCNRYPLQAVMPQEWKEMNFSGTLLRVTQWYTLLQTHCYRMFLHTAHRAVYYLTEEGIPWLASIRPHIMSHVPLLHTARVCQSIGPRGWQGIATEVKRACVQPLPQTQPHHLPHLFCINCHSFFPGSLGKEVVRQHYSQAVKTKNLDVSWGPELDSHYLILSHRLTRKADASVNA